MSQKIRGAASGGGSRYLILGGVRSGKSALAERATERLQSEISHAPAQVHYVATAEARDGEMADRIHRHQFRRPGHWGLIEEPLALAQVLKSQDAPGQILLIDCMSLWVSNLLHAGESRCLREEEAFLDALSVYAGSVVIVSNEVGWGLVGMDPLSRRFADALGSLNQSLAARCDHVWMSVAGLAITLKGQGPPAC
ncbi:adenosylcobinamide kinase/adenosylcobinamide-phosphate guanylyltransferase [Natronospira proteinivora]|uniref:Bifunctional adenosylcobalamin biosynthesis protein n=1 Tax=Natronospira proteinivora TaxID=1807133 RepID=A0ABT1G951_9GAMM|nr:bifunctional adenosylcobinamide kinase/adenosylcobinamide-phosphate guanylyltransferase [Natronospira proteinivora]MCP1726833.1 adenosylcobinamide kinase/adenosylcobinamide-phosphate guanylyltransferase [Natronospira proteinivora]